MLRIETDVEADGVRIKVKMEGSAKELLEELAVVTLDVAKQIGKDTPAGSVWGVSRYMKLFMEAVVDKDTEEAVDELPDKQEL